MIQLKCDNCEKPIEVADDQAGTKIPCPDCGDINRVPEPSTSAPPATPASDEAPEPSKARSDRAAEAGLPPDHGPEVRVVKVRRCWFRTRPLKFTLAVLVIVGGVFAIFWGRSHDWPAWLGWVWGAGIAGSFGLMGWWWLDRLGSALEITNKRTISHRGLFSRATSEVVHDNIRNVLVDQKVWQRVWGVGKLGISSSGQDGVEIQVNHLRNPGELRKMIDLYRPLD